MLEMNAEAIIAITTFFLAALIAGVIWGVRLEGRLNTQQALVVQQEAHTKDTAAALFNLIASKFDSVIFRLERLENAVTVNGNGGHHNGNQ